VPDIFFLEATRTPFPPEVKRRLEEEYILISTRDRRMALEYLLDNHYPNAIIVQLAQDHLEFIRTVRQQRPTTPLITLSFNFSDKQTRLDSLFSGADTALTIVDPEELVSQIKAMIRVNQRVEQPLQEEFCRRYNLTSKEAEIAKRLLLGMNQNEIAKSLNISWGICHSWIKSIYSKCGTKNKAGLVSLLSFSSI
jgi:DNA-binding NarL/FixJ family response regulator